MYASDYQGFIQADPPQNKGDQLVQPADSQMRPLQRKNRLYEEMLRKADPSQVAGLSRFFKTGPGQYGEGDKFLGIKVPVTRQVVKACWREVGLLELEDCIRSEYHEVRLAALLTLIQIFAHAKRCPVKPGMTANGQDLSVAEPGMTADGRDLSVDEPGMTAGGRDLSVAEPGMTANGRDLSVAELGMTAGGSCMARAGISQQDCVDFYLSHTAFINNWDLVDLSCYPLLGEWLLDKDRALLYDLARSGKTLWEQRIGIVSTMTFIRHGQTDDTFSIADILLHHPHDLIHKAVGWLLREAGKRDESALKAYLAGPLDCAPSVGRKAPSGANGDRAGWALRNSEVGAAGLGAEPRYKTMPRTMLRYAIERFPEAERRRYLSGV